MVKILGGIIPAILFGGIPGAIWAYAFKAPIVTGILYGSIAAFVVITAFTIFAGARGNLEDKEVLTAIGSFMGIIAMIASVGAIIAAIAIRVF